MSVRDRIGVHEGRWRSLDCDRPACCPPEGSALPSPDQVASAVAEFIGAGSAPLPDRETLADHLEPLPAAGEVADLLQKGASGRTTLTTREARHRSRQRGRGSWAIRAPSR